MSKEKIRVSLHSFNYKILDEACKKILSVISSTEKTENIKGPIPLPTRKEFIVYYAHPM